MKCPYCGAEVLGRFCEYCDSEVNPLAKGRDTRQVKTIRALCDEILEMEGTKGNCFASMLMGPDGERELKGSKINERLLSTLQIPREDSIYLIHDDTLFHSGKNGFAITSSGFYTKVVFQDSEYVSWQKFAEAETLKLDSYCVKADEKAVAYFSVSYASMSEQLLQSFRDMQNMIRMSGVKALN